MSTDRWFPLLGFFILAGVLTRSWLVVTLSIGMFVILGLASWWRKHSLDNVIYRRQFHYTRSFPDETVPLRLEIENRKLLPISWLRVQDSWPRAIGPDDENVLALSYKFDQGFLVNVFSLRWYERTNRSYNLIFRKRGYYEVGPAQMESGDLFGFYVLSRDVGQSKKLTVFPKLVPMSELELPPDNPFGDRNSRRRLFEDPNRPMGVREYHPEDGLRRVHWPATARTGRLQVKMYQPTSAHVMVLCLNVSTYARYWEGVYPALLERLISVAATLVDQGVQQGYRVGMISNGCLANSDQPFRIQPSRSPNQLGHVLEALAGVTSVVTAPFERFLLREIPRVPFGATLVIITAVTTPELAETLLKLKRHGRRISLLSLAERAPPTIPGVQRFHMPFKESPSNVN